MVHTKSMQESIPALFLVLHSRRPIEPFSKPLQSTVFRVRSLGLAKLRVELETQNSNAQAECSASSYHVLWRSMEDYIPLPLQKEEVSLCSSGSLHGC